MAWWICRINRNISVSSSSSYRSMSWSIYMYMRQTQCAIMSARLKGFNNGPTRTKNQS